eukprot:CAMPEP_0184384584 /NCGR_PEP_ID=MMETSP0007-20130409/7974_1 /TAXON_ID=97485 /ORGANISM="Prymnesium parvum, Strain Texoma1" /LENGTH=96 /DNA_ID=CAMNT_0026731469 /DNA_START=907 /DNA_END=1197 /DNA_ORIENTATION=-
MAGTEAAHPAHAGAIGREDDLHSAGPTKAVHAGWKPARREPSRESAAAAGAAAAAARLEALLAVLVVDPSLLCVGQHLISHGAILELLLGLSLLRI